MARIFRNAWFRKFARQQRVARSGGGRSGGYRTLVAFRAATEAIFVIGYAKSDTGNVKPDDERDLRALAKLVLGFTDADMNRLVAAGMFDEVRCDDAQD